MSDTVIKVEHLSKRYSIRHHGDDGLRHAIHDLATTPLRWLRRQHGAWSNGHAASKNGNGVGLRAPNSELRAPGSLLPANGASLSAPDSSLISDLRPPTSEDFWALKDVSFEVKQGEVVGIIGGNGAGKSTLLKVLSRIAEPTEGRVRIKGRAASLLEVGTGFHPELTGRENIYLNGALLGMSRDEIKAKFDEIVTFAEVEKFLDMPVKRYSSGMYVRLAFAIAAHLEPEILIVDEVLAVGDAQFQTKCLGKMQDVAQGGRTVLIVSHNMPMIRSLCSRAIVITGGSVAYDGNRDEGIQQYLIDRSTTAAIHSLKDRQDRGGNGRLKFVDAYVIGASGVRNVLRMGEDVQVVLAYFGAETIRICDISIHVMSVWDHAVLRLATRETAAPFNDLEGGVGCIICVVPKLRLLPGKYSLLIAASIPPAYEYLDLVSHAAAFEVIEDDVYGTGKVPEFGLFFTECQWRRAPLL